MKFRTMPVAEAEGAILAHSVMRPGVSFKKSRKLTSADVSALQDAGVTEVMAAWLEPGDVPEDVAAGRIARALAGGHVTVSEPFTGRANLYAAVAGLAQLDAAEIIALNGIDEGLTLATVPAFEPVSPHQMLATVKIIPFSLPEAVVAKAETMAAGFKIKLGVAPFRAATAGLILTRLSGTKPSVLEKRRQAVETRLAAAGSKLGPVETVDHDTALLAAAIGRQRAAGADPILVFGASAIVDRGDVIPGAVAAAGGAVVHVGMPVDPGNLLMLGRFQGADVIGVPSCAASPKVNGFDWVLQRLLAGLPVGRKEIIAMAPGGLLKEISSRPQPREGGAATASAERSEPRIAALILAAGRSSRMGPRNKLLEDVGGKPMARQVAETALASRTRPVLAVTGHQQAEVSEALARLDVALTHNPRFAEGIGTSIAAGVAALPEGLDGVMILLGDMPGVTAAQIDKLISAYAPKEGRAICVAAYEGKRGNPVLLGAEFFGALKALEGDTGARPFIARHPDVTVEVDLGSAAVLMDADTPEALAMLRKELGVSA